MKLTKAIIGLFILMTLLGGISGYSGSVEANGHNIRNNIVTDFTMTREDIYTFMVEGNFIAFAQYGIADGTYALPSKYWFRDEFSSVYGKFIDQLHQDNYSSENNDCDDFARSCAFFAQLLHHNTYHKIDKTGLAVGEFWYTIDKNRFGPEAGKGHAINFIICRDPDRENKVSILFYDPQLRAFVALTDNEIDSCTYWRI